MVKLGNYVQKNKTKFGYRIIDGEVIEDCLGMRLVMYGWVFGVVTVWVRVVVLKDHHVPQHIFLSGAWEPIQHPPNVHNLRTRETSFCTKGCLIS